MNVIKSIYRLRLFRNASRSGVLIAPINTNAFYQGEQQVLSIGAIDTS